MTEPPYRCPASDLLAGCVIETYRSHGPGGQHANRTDSAVRLTHRATGIVAQCQDHRQQARNQSDALRRLRVRLACGIRGQSDLAWLSPWLRGGRITIGAQAEVFPAIVALALDAMQAHSGQLAPAALALGCSSSQLTKLLTADKDVHQATNALRATFAVGPIHARS